MQDKVQSQRPQLCEVSAALIAEEGPRATAEFNIHIVTTSDLTLQGEVEQLARRGEDIRREADRRCHHYDCRVKDVLFQRDGVQVRIDAMVSQPSGARNSLRAACERPG